MVGLWDCGMVWYDKAWCGMVSFVFCMVWNGIACPGK